MLRDQFLPWLFGGPTPNPSPSPSPSPSAALTSPEAIAAIIAAIASVVTLIGPIITQRNGRRATSQDVDKTLEAQGEQLNTTLVEQRKQLNRTLAEQRKQLDRTLAEQRTRALNERFAAAAGQLGGDKPPAVRLSACRKLTRLLDLVLGVAGRLGDVRGDACGQARWGGDWLNVVFVLVQQVPDFGEGSPDGAAAGAEQVGEGVVGQAEAQVEHGGHDAVGEGEEWWPAGAGLVPGVAGRVAAGPLLALGLPQGGELGDELVQVAGGQPGQLGERRGAAVMAGAGWRPCGGPGGGVEGVVPVAVEGVAAGRQGGHLRVADLDPGGVGAVVQAGLHGQAGAGGGRGDAVDDDVMAGQR